MTKRDLFKVAIRLFGLLSLVSSLFQTLPSLVEYNLRYITTPVVVIAVIIVLLLLMFYRLIFLYTDKIIDWLRLSDGFEDDKIVFGESSFYTLVKLSIVMFGIYILVVNVPAILSDLYFLFKSKVSRSNVDYGQYQFKPFDWYYYISNMIIAGLFVIYPDWIARKISDNRNDK